MPSDGIVSILPMYTCSECGGRYTIYSMCMDGRCAGCHEGYIKHPSDIPLLFDNIR